jgi:MinD-like ATPase involved in chromosome partitioning or flagellar assembly
MALGKIVSIHSYRGGTGKSNSCANIATMLAMMGLTVGVVDTDIQSPGMHVLFGLQPDDVERSLNDYLWGRSSIADVAVDVTGHLKAAIPGKLYLIPSSVKTNEIARVLREGYDVGLLNDGFHQLVEELQLDVLVIDTHPGLNEETLLSIAISDALAVILRPDQQDYQGTGVTIEVARRLEVPRLLLIVNKVPPAFSPDDVQARVRQTYGCEVAGVLPHSDEMMTLASAGIFALAFPDHPMTETYRNIARRMVED